MSLEQLRDANQRRHKEWAHGEAVDLSFRGVELAGEVGEVCNEIKKLERVRLNLVGGKTDLEGIKEELADVMISADLIAMDLGIDMGAEIQKKFDKTSAKYNLSARFYETEEAKEARHQYLASPALDYEPLDLDEIESECQRVDGVQKQYESGASTPASDKQIGFLKKMGYDGDEKITKAEASRLIPIYKEKCGFN